MSPFFRTTTSNLKASYYFDRNGNYGDHYGVESYDSNAVPMPSGFNSLKGSGSFPKNTSKFGAFKQQVMGGMIIMKGKVWNALPRKGSPGHRNERFQVQKLASLKTAMKERIANVKLPKVNTEKMLKRLPSKENIKEKFGAAKTGMSTKFAYVTELGERYAKKAAEAMFPKRVDSQSNRAQIGNQRENGQAQRRHQGSKGPSRSHTHHTGHRKPQGHHHHSGGERNRHGGGRTHQGWSRSHHHRTEKPARRQHPRNMQY